MTAHPFTGYSIVEALSGLSRSVVDQPRLSELVEFCGYDINRTIDAIMAGANDSPIPLSWPLNPLKRNLINIRQNERRRPWPDLNRIQLCTGVITEIEAMEQAAKS